MAARTIRVTATLPLAYVDELRELAKSNEIPSVNFAINEALDRYIKSRKAAQYDDLMRKAGQDKAFLKRTTDCAEDFRAIDGEVSGSW